MKRRPGRDLLSPRDQQLLEAADHLVSSIAFPDSADGSASNDYAWEIFEQVAATVAREAQNEWVPGDIARAVYRDGSGFEMALLTTTGWVGTKGPITEKAEQAFDFERVEVS